METQCNNEQRRWQMNLSGQQREKATTFFSCEGPARLPRGRTISSAWMQTLQRRRVLPPAPPLPSRGSCFITITSPSRSTLCVTVMAQTGVPFYFCAATHTWMPFFFFFSSRIHAGRRALEGSTPAHSLLFLAWKREWSSVCLSRVALFCHT